MYYKILKAFGFAIHSEQDFYISKKDGTHFKITAKNGLSATVEIADDTLFVDILDKSQKNVAYYCTKLADTPLSIDEFVIKNIQDSILFKLPAKDVEHYLRSYITLFKEVRHIHYPPMFDLEDSHLNKNSKKINDGYFYQHTKHNKICYSHVYFAKKKVIRNIVRYSFSTEPLHSSDSYKESHYYGIGDTFFEVCNLEQFFRSTSDTTLASYSFDIDDLLYGINNQLTEHHHIYKANIDLKKVILLKRNNKNYCLMTKNNRTMTLSYLADFDVQYSKLEKNASYSSERAEFKGIETPVHRYKHERLITYTYFRGQIKSTSTKFSSVEAAAHEMAISDGVMNHFNAIKLKYPSNKVLSTLRDLGLSYETPLNPDDLLVLDMSEI